MAGNPPTGDGAVNLRVLDASVRLEFGPKLHARVAGVRSTWMDCLADPHSPAEGRVIEVLGEGEHPTEPDRQVVHDHGDWLAAETALAGAITLAGVDQRAGELMMLHAAALAHATHGRTIGFVAPSGTGKTTLCRTLGTAGRGWRYVTDETLALTPDGAVVPYPKPLSVIEGDPSGKRQIPVAELGIEVATGELQLGALALLRRSPTPVEATLEIVPMLEAFALLAPETSYLARHARPLQVLAGLLERTGGLRRLTYSEAADLVPLVTRLMEEP